MNNGPSTDKKLKDIKKKVSARLDHNGRHGLTCSILIAKSVCECNTILSAYTMNRLNA